MTGDNKDNIGTAGSTADFPNYEYPAVPYRREHFHYPHCHVDDYNNALNVRFILFYPIDIFTVYTVDLVKSIFRKLFYFIAFVIFIYLV